MANFPKIICPAPSKTGTVSLTSALGRLGLRIAHYPHDSTTIHQCFEKGEPPTKILNQYDGICDLPAAVWWRELLGYFGDEGCLVICVHRDAMDWIKSMKRHYKKNSCHVNNISVHHLWRVAFFGIYGFNERKMLWRYSRHYDELSLIDNQMLHYPRRWLNLSLEVDNKIIWRRLCEFLKPFADEEMRALIDSSIGAEFPRLNVST